MRWRDRVDFGLRCLLDSDLSGGEPSNCSSSSSSSSVSALKTAPPKMQPQMAERHVKLHLGFEMTEP